MTPDEITLQLEDIASVDDFLARSEQLTAAWSSAGVGVEAVEPILRFMEKYPLVDLGTPGPLVHFVERHRGSGYDRWLVESVRRQPTAHTVWMLSRLINGTQSSAVKRRLIETMEGARFNPLAGPDVQQRLIRYLEKLLPVVDSRSCYSRETEEQ